MRRGLLMMSILAPVVAAAVAGGCGPDQSSALDTLPAIVTTTSTTTVTTTPDDRRKFYTVKAGDNINEIARSFQVPRHEIVELNKLPNEGGWIEIGQILEIPTDVVMIENLPEECNCGDG